MFTATFDHHVEQQSLAYLSSHEEFKTHGKKNTKHLRWALLFFILLAGLDAGTTVPTWPTEISTAAMEAAQVWTDYCERLQGLVADVFGQVAETGAAVGGSVTSPVKITAALDKP